jgi:hypothetical protein
MQFTCFGIDQTNLLTASTVSTSAKIIYFVKQRTNLLEFFAKAKMQLNDHKQQAETIIDSQSRCWTLMEKRSGETLNQRILGSNPTVSTIFLG